MTINTINMAKQLTIIISLHGYCNLRCRFCYQCYNQIYPKTFDMVHYQTCIQKLWKQFYRQFAFNKYKKINFIFQGGELFLDHLSENIIQEFETIKKHINNYFNRFNYSIRVISNGLFSNRQHILNFLNYLNATVIFSYDPTDRFLNENMKQKYINTLDFFSKHNKIDSFNILLTKKNIKEYINGNSQIQDLCKKYNVNFNILNYIDNQNSQIYKPSAQELRHFYKYAFNKKWHLISNDLMDIKNKKIYDANVFRLNPSIQQYEKDNNYFSTKQIYQEILK